LAGFLNEAVRWAAGPGFNVIEKNCISRGMIFAVLLSKDKYPIFTVIAGILVVSTIAIPSRQRTIRMAKFTKLTQEEEIFHE